MTGSPTKPRGAQRAAHESLSAEAIAAADPPALAAQRGPNPRGSEPSGGPRTEIGRSGGGLRFTIRSSGVEPALRLGLLGLVLAMRHGLGTALDRLSPSRAPARASARLERSGRDVVWVLGTLKGVFAKAGQFASTRPDLVPVEVHSALESLRDRVPPLPFSQIRTVIESELGAPLVACFARVGHRPIGAASVAQVHRAWLHDGTAVAIKVQYPWLERSLGPDLAILRAFLRPILRARGVSGAFFDRLFKEFGAGLALELDFEAEARTAALIAENLADDPAVVVPRVHTSLTRRRVLTLDHVDGVPVSSGRVLKEAGASPEAVVAILTRAYTRQIFIDGLFHADPHPGNLLAIPTPGDPDHPRVGFLDFGLSRQLSPELRSAIRQALFAVLKRDPAAFVEHMQALEMIQPNAEAGVRAAVDTMFERMGSGVLQQSGSAVLSLKDDAKTLLRDTPGLQLPDDLLLYAKTLSYLFHLGETLAPDVDLMKIAVPQLLRFLAERDPAPHAASVTTTAAIDAIDAQAPAHSAKAEAGVSADVASPPSADPADG